MSIGTLPFLSNDPMEGDPPTQWTDFLTPQLRQFSLVYNQMHVQEVIGHGIEGCVARVKFDDDELSYAIKIVSALFLPPRLTKVV
jgi:hypothetical protein